MRILEPALWAIGGAALAVAAWPAAIWLIAKAVEEYDDVEWCRPYKWQWLVIIAEGALAGWGLLARLHPIWLLLGFVPAVWLLLAAALVDLRLRLLPRRACWAAVAFLLAVEIPGGTLGHTEAHLWEALAAGVGLGLLFALLYKLAPAQSGLGDARAVVAVGMLLGWFGVYAVIVGMAISFVTAAGGALVVWVALLARRGRRWTEIGVPLGPFLVLACAISPLVATLQVLGGGGKML